MEKRCQVGEKVSGTVYWPWLVDQVEWVGMGRPHRAAEGGYVYHVLNRANARTTIFAEQEDFAAFEKVLLQAVERSSTRLLAYCLMPNHWHLVVWPRKDNELSKFLGWLTLTHTQRWHAHRDSAGTGHLYQGRFKSFPIQQDEHLYAVARYVERNALRANLVRRAEQWHFGSLARWLRGSAEDQSMLAAWPVPRKANWVEYVNAPQSEAEVAAVRYSVQRGSPFGDESWSDKTVRRLALESTLRPRGRPKKRIGS
jgi:putative transposase